MCLPVVTTLSDVYLGADVQAITGLLANMGKHVWICRDDILTALSSNPLGSNVRRKDSLFPRVLSKLQT